MGKGSSEHVWCRQGNRNQPHCAQFPCCGQKPVEIAWTFSNTTSNPTKAPNHKECCNLEGEAPAFCSTDPGRITQRSGLNYQLSC